MRPLKPTASKYKGRNVWPNGRRTKTFIDADGPVWYNHPGEFEVLEDLERMIDVKHLQRRWRFVGNVVQAFGYMLAGVGVAVFVVALATLAMHYATILKFLPLGC